MPNQRIAGNTWPIPTRNSTVPPLSPLIRRATSIGLQPFSAKSFFPKTRDIRHYPTPSTLSYQKYAYMLDADAQIRDEQRAQCSDSVEWRTETMDAFIEDGLRQDYTNWVGEALDAASTEDEKRGFKGLEEELREEFHEGIWVFQAINDRYLKPGNAHHELRRRVEETVGFLMRDRGGKKAGVEVKRAPQREGFSLKALKREGNVWDNCVDRALGPVPGNYSSG